TLWQLALQDYYAQNKGGDGRFIVGFDASLWFYDCSALARSGPSGARIPQLTTLFYQLLNILSTLIVPLFVFDGPGRATKKWNKLVKMTRSWLERDFQWLLSALGIPWIIAPGDAKAELSNLSKEHVIDAVHSEDSDTLPFGATTVLRCATPNTYNGSVKEITSERLHNQASLSREDLIFFAVLSGGDFNKGLKDCGDVTALGLAKCGLRRQLVLAVQELSGSELSQFLSSWCQDLRGELNTNSHGFLNSKHPHIAQNVQDDFPNPDIVRAYSTPLTSSSSSSSSSSGSKTLHRTDIQLQSPSISALARIGMAHIWKDASDVLVAFHNNLWGAMCMQMLGK
ncbi:hypothetical protein JAAARDRAFT_97135, partial [Jaapia argillacea MUCL 33604]